MVSVLVIVVVSFLASGLTLFSGFGLGTILMPAFALFFPVDMAIALTAVVHFLNNIFKLFLLGRQADKSVVLNFGLPGIVGALIGAKVLFWVNKWPDIATYSLGEKIFSVTPLKLAVAILLIAFVLLESLPKFKQMTFPKKYLRFGGFLSGFFGGFSGQQGALRSAFLIKSGLTKEAYIATGVVIACLVDMSRLAAYNSHFRVIKIENNVVLIAAIVAAFLGAYLGNKYIKKITLETVQRLVAVMLFIIAILLGSGLI
jgi:uncharacterized membrane protein YfcA